MKLHRLAFVLFFVFSTCFAQVPDCPHDSLVNGGNPNGTIDFSTGNPYTGACGFGCEPNTYNCWQLLPNVDLVLTMAGNPAPPNGDVAIVIMSECRWINYVRCQELGNPITSPFMLSLHTGPDMQVCAFWNSMTTDSVGAFVKAHPGPNPTLPVIGSMDSCYAPLNAANAVIETPPSYMDVNTGLIVDKFPEMAGVYARFYPERPWILPVKLVVRIR